MPFTKPDKLPELASQDVNNGILGAANVQEPPTDLKEEGYDFGQKPEREFFNWYGRYYYLWHGWTDQEMEAMKLVLTSLQTKTQNADSLFVSKW